MRRFYGKWGGFALVVGMLFSASADTVIPQSYSLDNPQPAPIFLPSEDGSQTNAWAAANAVYVATAGYVVGETDNKEGSPDYRFEFAEAGFTWERLKPDSYLNDRIVAPSGEIDWAATFARYQANLEADGSRYDGFLFNNDETDPCVYVADGGVHSFEWVYKDGTSKTLSYVCATVCQGRPRRIYWTDYPYNGTPISLQGKFVRFFGSDAILGLQKATVTNIVGGVEVVQPDTVVSGLYIDETSMLLYARGKVTGQVLMAYYDDGNYDSILAVQTVEVCQPDVIVNSGEVGTALKPDGRGYDVEGLTALVKAGIGDVLDGRGDYLYQHTGVFSYSPKNKDVFPLRPTEGERWKAEIWWMETDAMKVQWPFEIDQYNVDWPVNIQRYVRGDVDGDEKLGANIKIPDDYTVKIQTYQEPDGHARMVEDKVFHTIGPGKSLLKITMEDNVWFMPVMSINRSDENFYAPAVGEVRVGEEFTIHSGTASGIAPGVTFHATMDEPGYIYKPTSCTDYDNNLYTTTNAIPSIYAVAAHPGQTIEVWWSEQFQRDDMPEPIAVPALPQVYQPVWPTLNEAPQIVIASQKGSAGESLFPVYGTAQFVDAKSVLHLEEREYFPDQGVGTIMFWMRSSTPEGEAKTMPDGGLFALGRGKRAKGPVRMFVQNGNLTVACNGQNFKHDGGAIAFADKPADEWQHIALTWNAAGEGTLYIDGEVHGTGSVTLDQMKGVLTDGLVGKTGDDCLAGLEFGELLIYSRAMTGEEVNAERFKTHSGDETGLTGYYSFRADGELVAETQSAEVGTTQFHNRVGNAVCSATGASFSAFGPPSQVSMPITSETTPTIYYQNDPNDKEHGYNPNDEHAFVRAGEGGFVAWALRCDLATENTPPPAVLVEYVSGGKARMQFYHVQATNMTWPKLADTCTAGTILPGPHPLDLMDNPWLPETFWDKEVGHPGPAYRDRKLQIWGRAAGLLDIHMYYAMQESFNFPSIKLEDQPAAGTPIPWLACLKDETANPLTENPATWTWTINWPENVPEMKIGQTLTVAAGGLPEVWNAKSISVIYPNPGEEADKVVKLSDPTVKQAVKFDYTDLEKCGLSINANGGLTYRKGMYYFTELPPSLSNRLYLDASNNTLCFIGERVEKNAGVSILYPNVLSRAERKAAINIVDEDVKDRELWEEAVNGLANEPYLPNTMGTTNGNSEITTTYSPVDHYALTAMGGTNYVTIIENDATDDRMSSYTVMEDVEVEIKSYFRRYWHFLLYGTKTETEKQEVVYTYKTSVKEGDPINMHIFKVVPEYYVGRAVTREDEVNLLSQQLSVVYTEPFGGTPDDYEFEWKSAPPNQDGTIPTDYENLYQSRPVSTNCGEVVGSSATIGEGLTRFVVGQQGDTLANMVNKYWVCRYRAKDETVPAYETMSNRWSAWTSPPALAEGWIQRVLNNVTPFNQRMTDLYENNAETAVSMLQQAGAPFEGDVALNQDNLTSVGLIQLYETILNKAETMSIMLGVNDEGANKQLQLAVERLGDLYKVLGDEAYSDAKNPTIGIGTLTDGMEGVEFGGETSSLFCFDNQVPSLLDEELALLRGRTGASAPTTRIGPYYNRLLWNFTKGITAGEVAYAVNYNVSGTETVALSEEQAARTYPQGHGDAYGHYLSALKGWYRLLRNPYFSWGKPAQGEMNVADVAVNVDYYEEAKFAEAAADLAKTAADVVDLTARKAWRDEGGGGYLDSDPENAFGSGEWASRGGYGALVNWVTANSILPASTATNTSAFASFDDPGLMRIDRGTVDELADICLSADEIVRKLDRVDAGLNPLGLSDYAVPFDISPDGVEDGSNTHFEQIRDRAKTALHNAKMVLDRAQTQSTRLRLIEETANQYADEITDLEEDIDDELLDIFGSPYSDDIGPGKTYPQGYDGPDLIHYMWMDLDKYGLDDVKDGIDDEKTYYEYGDMPDYTTNFLGVKGFANDSSNKEMAHVLYEKTASGLIKKPDEITGVRTHPGSIQACYADFLLEYAVLMGCLDDFEGAKDELEVQDNYLTTLYGFTMAETLYQGALFTFKYVAARAAKVLQDAIDDASKAAEDAEFAADHLDEGIPAQVGVGTTAITDPKSTTRLITWKLAWGYRMAWRTLDNANSEIGDKLELAEETLDAILEAEQMARETAEGVADLVGSYCELIDGVNDAAGAIVSQMAVVNACVDAYCAEVARGQELLEKREALRKRQVNNLSKLRYNEMFFRKLRDKTLTRYSKLFDIAQQYVFQAAQVYGYETALMSDEDGSADEFKAQIVATRSLGAFDSNDEPMVADDGDVGLAGYLAEMDQNWLVLKPRLGINNPQPYATWFSLRSELFRILPGEEGNPAWAKELMKYWVDDILANPEFKRYCLPFQSQYGLKDKEPGLVIPFSTTIDFARNFFGHELAGGDHAYDSTWYSTRVAAAGVWFDGYNTKAEGGLANAAPQLANTPVVYLVPAGFDRLRAPGQTDGKFWNISVVDQVIPAPWKIGSYELDSETWMPSLANGDYLGADSETKIRKHPSFRAYFDVAGGEPSDDQLDATRLIGRSVWNTRWLLVIPAGAMNADREKALQTFINGFDVNRDGQLDLAPVNDIKIGFKTYSQAGN